MERTVITAENIGRIREQLPRDQAAALQVGCLTWQFGYESFVGHITVWPTERRAAVAWNGNSSWGDWDGDCNVIRLDEGGCVTADGELVG